MKYSLNFIKDHFGYCMEEGMLFGEDEEILMFQLYDKAEKAERYERAKKRIKEKMEEEDPGTGNLTGVEIGIDEGIRLALEMISESLEGESE